MSGLLLLFSSKASFGGTPLELWGAAAVVAASLAYCLGSVLARPLLKDVKPLELTAAQAIVAAVGLSVLSLAARAGSLDTFRALLAPAPLAGLLFLVIGGTFIAQTIFLRLLHDWGAPRAGLYSFVSPVVALILGAILFGEPLTWREMTGAAIMLAAAWIAVARRAGPMLRPRKPRSGERRLTEPRYDAVIFDLLTALLDSWTLWNSAAGSPEAGSALAAQISRTHIRAGRLSAL